MIQTTNKIDKRVVQTLAYRNTCGISLVNVLWYGGTLFEQPSFFIYIIIYLRKGTNKMIYFDHAASSYPKPDSVAHAMHEAVSSYSANPGRGGHKLAERARSVINEARKTIASFFNAPSSKHVWFYQNATMALNQALLGFPFEEGDHVVATKFEHNSIIRPLERLVIEKKITVTYVEPNVDGVISVDAMKKAITNKTRMFAISHASNVTGAIVPLREISLLTKEKQIMLLLDASQTAGTISIDIDRDGIDLLALAGHKSLLGPQGTGVLVTKGDFDLRPLIVGGTGGHLSHLFSHYNGLNVMKLEQ